MTECSRCNGYGFLVCLVTGMVPCPKCDPYGRVCCCCGGDLENFEDDTCNYCIQAEEADPEGSPMTLQVKPDMRMDDCKTLTYEQYQKATPSELKADSC
jgi:hypothetical protein